MYNFKSVEMGVSLLTIFTFILIIIDRTETHVMSKTSSEKGFYYYCDSSAKLDKHDCDKTLQSIIGAKGLVLYGCTMFDTISYQQSKVL